MIKLTPQIVSELLKSEQLDLSSTQARLCFPILERIYTKLSDGERFSPIKIEDGVIVDGHHRYICLKILNIEVNSISWTKAKSVDVVPWNIVEIDETDWEK